jgi:hypothetical protein
MKAYYVSVEVKTRWIVRTDAVDENDADEIVSNMDLDQIETQGGYQELLSVEVGEVEEVVR